MWRRKRRWSAAAAILALAAGMMACGIGDGNGNGNGNGNGTGGVADVGFVVVNESTTVGSGIVPFLQIATVDAFAGFLRLGNPLPAAFFADPWGGVAGTCEVFSITDLPGGPLDRLPLPDDLDPTFVDAGDAITVTAGGLPYLQLNRFEMGGFDGYTTPGPAVGTLPPDLRANVPGNDFPAVSAAAFADAAPFSLIAPANAGKPGAVVPGTVFGWTGATAHENAVVLLEIVSNDAQTFVDCFAPDTGTFALPEATRATLGPSFSGRVEAAMRQVVRVEAVDEARLLLAVTRGQFFDVPIVVPIGDGDTGP